MAKFGIGMQTLGENAVLVTVEGFLDAYSFEEFEKQMDEILESDKSNVAVDMSRLEYISSAGAGVLISAMSRTREKGGKLVLVNPSAEVAEVLSLLGITQLVETVSSVEEAARILAS